LEDAFLKNEIPVSFSYGFLFTLFNPTIKFKQNAIRENNSKFFVSKINGGKKIEAVVIRIESKNYYTLTDENKILICSLRGRLKKQLQLKKDKLFLLDPVAVGDRVKISKVDEKTGVIEEVLPRKNYLSRKAPRKKGASFKGERLEQIIAANVDVLAIVSSVVNPKFNNRLLDRILVAAESSRIEAKIILNKIDLDEKNERAEWTELYSSIYYDVFETSAVKMLGLDELISVIKGKTTLFWGASGVGKSSLLNSLFPNLKLKVGTISHYSLKGKHTTVTVNMIKIDKQTFVIDTPGIREIEPYGLRKEDLGHMFVEFKPFIQNCKFNSCTHYHEPGCAVVKAVELGEISKHRYISYLNILRTFEETNF